MLADHLGSAGHGSDGADGGNGGTIEIVVHEDQVHLLMAVKWDVGSGKGGQAGQHGRPGQGGSKGKGGKGYEWYVYSSIYWKQECSSLLHTGKGVLAMFIVVPIVVYEVVRPTPTA